MQPKISIIVPVYKVKENLLRACAESCINQEEKNIEIIFVDDCSKDLSSQICDEYALKDTRIKVIHKERNGGLSAARNTGFLASTGVWITFVDGDDWIDTDTCSMVNKIFDDEIQLIIFGTIREYESRQDIFQMPYNDKQIFENEDCKKLQSDILDYSKRVATVPAKIFKRKFLAENKIFHDEELKCGIDGIEFNVRMAGFLKKAIVFDEYKYHYVYNLESITGAPSENTNRLVLLGLEKIKSYIESNHCSEELKNNYVLRVQRIINDTSIVCYFNPNFSLKYKERKEKLNTFLITPIIAETLNHTKFLECSKIKKIIYFSAKHRLYVLLKLFGWLRVKYLSQH